MGFFDKMIREKDQDSLVEVIESKSNNDYNRWMATSYLGDFGKKTSQRTVDVLIGLLDDGNQNVRDHAADSLGRIAMSSKLEGYIIGHALQPLMRLLLRGESLGAASAAKALGEIGDPSAGDVLIQVLETRRKWWQIRKNAAIALGLIGEKKAIKPLINALQDRYSPDIRIGAAESLSKLGDTTAIEYLEVLKDDENINVRIAGESAIKSLQNK